MTMHEKKRWIENYIWDPHEVEMKYFYLLEKPQVTSVFPNTSKSDRVPECAERTCSHFKVLGSLKRI